MDGLAYGYLIRATDDTVPDGWLAYKAECKGTGCTHIEVTGCVPSRRYTKGPRAGKPDYSSPVAGTKMTRVLETSAANDWISENWPPATSLPEAQP